MSQIITLAVGGCGVNVGLSFWEQLAERKAKQSPDSHKVYYERVYDINNNGKEKPRALFIDTDINSNIRASSNKVGFDTNLIFGYGSSCNNLYPAGRHGVGYQAKEPICNALRRQVEKCDALSGFLLIKSSQGGAGSGMGHLLTSQIRNQYPYQILQQINVLDGIDIKKQNTNMDPLQIYNTILYHSSTCHNIDMQTTFENNAIHRILQARKMKPTYKQINKYIGNCLNEHINCYIQGGLLNTSQRKRLTNLLLFPRIKYICGGLSQPDAYDHVCSSLQRQNRTISINSTTTDQRIYSLSVNVRDSKISEKQVHQSVNIWKRLSNCQFVEWINSFSISIYKNEKKNEERTWTLYNGSIITQNFRRIGQLYTNLYRKKAFLHHYVSAGLDPLQFTQAESNFNDFLSQYNVYISDGNEDNYEQ